MLSLSVSLSEVLTLHFQVILFSGLPVPPKYNSTIAIVIMIIPMTSDGDYLVFVVATPGLEGMGAANKHSRLLGLGNHSDVVLALRLSSGIMIIMTIS